MVRFAGCAGGLSAAVLAVLASRASGELLDTLQLGPRWTSTYTNGTVLAQGTPTTITWSIVPDGTYITAGVPDRGETSGGSNLIAKFDQQFGIIGGGSDLTTRSWFPIFSNSFDRWSQLAGLTYVYKTDDGMNLSNTYNGSATRGDVRIGGHTIDGASNILAYNYYPNYGDMVLDTADMSYFGQSANSYRFARNTIMHEHGHGIGIAHVESNNSDQLMEPYISSAFDGPQFDDILAAQRLYGDALEKNGGNDTSATAMALGAINYGSTISRGTSANSTVVAATDVDFLSIDDEADVDFFRFTAGAHAAATITVTPKGPTYNQGPQNGTQTSFNTAMLSDLALALLGSNGSTVLSSVNFGGLGSSESILSFVLPGAGDYFVRINGLTTDAIQMYQLDVALTLVPEPGMLGGLVATGLLLRRRCH